MATTSVCVHRASPSCFLPLWESLQDELVGLTQGSCKALSAMLGLEMCEILCAPFRYGDSVSSSSSLHKLWWPSKPDVLGVSSQHWTPRLGSLRWGLDHLLTGENLCHCDHPLICG